MCLPFYSLLLKIILHEGVSPPRDEKLLVCRCPISISSLKKSKSHSFAKRKQQTLSIPPKDEFVQHVTHLGHGLAAHTTETTSFHIPAPSTVSTQPGQSSFHADRFTIWVEGLHERVSGLTNVIYSINNQVQLRLTTIETQLDEIQHKLEESLQLFVPKRGRTYSLYRLYRLDDSIQKGGVFVSSNRKANTQYYTLGLLFLLIVIIAFI